MSNDPFLREQNKQGFVGRVETKLDQLPIAKLQKLHEYAFSAITKTTKGEYSCKVHLWEFVPRQATLVPYQLGFVDLQCPHDSVEAINADVLLEEFELFTIVTAQLGRLKVAGLHAVFSKNENSVGCMLRIQFTAIKQNEITFNMMGM
ncbi:MAG: hypothetical protein MUC43_07985 [Pirellula sp.]|jgi:hypothetical protein|nr:hypothetical protein [Pirellula sp.]